MIKLSMMRKEKSQEMIYNDSVVGAYKSFIDSEKFENILEYISNKSNDIVSKIDKANKKELSKEEKNIVTRSCSRKARQIQKKYRKLVSYMVKDEKYSCLLDYRFKGTYLDFVKDIKQFTPFSFKSISGIIKSQKYHQKCK